MEAWNKVLEIPLSLEEYHKAFSYIGATTISTKLRDFQFRLLHKRLPSNKELHRWKIKNTDKCEFCDQQDSILHLLFGCIHIKMVWKDLFEYMKKWSDPNILNFDIQNLILNMIHPKKYHVINLMCLIMKQLIYRYKCKKEKINFTAFIIELRLVENIERYNAKKQNILHKHNCKWLKFKNLDTRTVSHEDTNLMILSRIT